MKNLEDSTHKDIYIFSRFGENQDAKEKNLLPIGISKEILLSSKKMKQIKHVFKKANEQFKKWGKEIQKRKQRFDEETEKEITRIPKKEEESQKKMVLELSLSSVAKATLIVFGIYFLSTAFLQLIDVLVIFGISLFLAAAFNPSVNRMENWGVPRYLGVILLFIFLLVFLGFFLGSLIPNVALQLGEIAEIIIEFVGSVEGSLRSYLESMNEESSFWSQFLAIIVKGILEILVQVDAEALANIIKNNINLIAQNLTDLAKTGFDVIYKTINLIFKVVITLFLTFFLVIDRKNLNDFFQSLFPAKYQGYLTEKMHLVQKKIGEWVHGQILLSLIVGFTAYIGLLLIGFDYPLTLAMVAGIAEFVPYVGPLVFLATGAPVAFNESLVTGLLFLMLHIIIQFLEGNIILPLVMKRAVGLPPVVTMIALIVGASFPDIIHPILGMILSVPLATIVSIFVRDFTERHERKKSIFQLKTSKAKE